MDITKPQSNDETASHSRGDIPGGAIIADTSGTMGDDRRHESIADHPSLPLNPLRPGSGGLSTSLPLQYGQGGRGRVLLAKAGSPGFTLKPGIEGLDRVLGGGLRLRQWAPGAPSPATTVTVAGADGAGKTTFALLLASALCRVHGRGVVLYLCAPGRAEEVHALLRAYDDGGFAWVRLGLDDPGPAVATGVVIVEAGVDDRAAAEGGAPEYRHLAGRVWQCVCRAEEVLSQATPLRAVVIDNQRDSDDPAGLASMAPFPDGPVDLPALADLMRRLCRGGVSVVVAGPAAGPEAPVPTNVRTEVRLDLSLWDPEVSGRSLRVRRSPLPSFHPGPHLLSMGDGAVRVLPPPSLYPVLCHPPEPPLRMLPMGRFGDPTVDQRAEGQPWLPPQSRVLIYSADPNCLLLMANRFLAESPRRLALFFTAPAPRAPRGPAFSTGPGPGDDCHSGTLRLRRTRTGAEIVAQVAQVLGYMKRRWATPPKGHLAQQAPAEVPRVALIDPGVLLQDGHYESSPQVLDAALLSVCGEAGVMALLARTTDHLPSWWSDFDLVLHIQPGQNGPDGVAPPRMRVVIDQVTSPMPSW